MVTSRMTIILFDWIHFLNPPFHVMSSFHKFFLQTLSKKWLCYLSPHLKYLTSQLLKHPFFLPPLTNAILLSFCKDHFPGLSFQPFHLSPHLPSLATAFLTLQTQAAWLLLQNPFTIHPTNDLYIRQRVVDTCYRLVHKISQTDF